MPCAYTPNIPTKLSHPWHLWQTFYLKIVVGIEDGFYMTKMPNDKSSNNERAISNMKRFSWNKCLDALQFIFIGITCKWARHID